MKLPRDEGEKGGTSSDTFGWCRAAAIFLLIFREGASQFTKNIWYTNWFMLDECISGLTFFLSLFLP